MRILLILIIVFITSNCFAGEKELITEQQTLLRRLQEYQRVTADIQTRLIEIQGVLKYIREKEEPKK